MTITYNAWIYIEAIDEDDDCMAQFDMPEPFKLASTTSFQSIISEVYWACANNNGMTHKEFEDYLKDSGKWEAYISYLLMGDPDSADKVWEE